MAQKSAVWEGVLLHRGVGDAWSSAPCLFASVISGSILHLFFQMCKRFSGFSGRKKNGGLDKQNPPLYTISGARCEAVSPVLS